MMASLMTLIIIIIFLTTNPVFPSRVLFQMGDALGEFGGHLFQISRSGLSIIDLLPTRDMDAMLLESTTKMSLVSEAI